MFKVHKSRENSLANHLFLIQFQTSCPFFVKKKKKKQDSPADKAFGGKGHKDTILWCPIHSNQVWAEFPPAE